MSKLKLYRQRFIPQEKILLKDDIIVSHTKDFLITSLIIIIFLLIGLLFTLVK